MAKKLESMLETALSQLKMEQKKRKESETRLMELELDLVNKEHSIKTLEHQLEEMSRDKDEKINSLESSINYLQSVIIEKEQEIMRLQELTEKIKASDNVAGEGMSATVNKFQETLNNLMKNSHNTAEDDDDMIENNAQEEIVIADSRPESREEQVFVETGIEESDEQFHGFPDQDDDDDEGEEYILDESMEGLQREEEQVVEITAEVKEEEPAEIKDVKLFVSSDPKGKTCQVCGASFKTKGKLSEHQNKEGHTPKFECDECGKYFKTKGTLVQHKTRIHSDVMPFKCSKCDRRFKDQGSMRRHEANDSVHIRNENIKHNPNLLCNICGKEFDRNRRWCLDQHLIIHLKNKGRFLNLKNR